MVALFIVFMALLSERNESMFTFLCFAVPAFFIFINHVQNRREEKLWEYRLNGWPIPPVKV